MKKNLEGVWCALGVFLIFAAAAAFCRDAVPKPEIDESVSLAETIEDHRLARSHVGYLHDGAKAFRRSHVCGTATNDQPVAVWFALEESEPRAKLTFWQKVKSGCRAFAKRFKFDENGAVVITKSQNAETLPAGCYVYLGSVRVEVDVKLAGTYVFEFPFYMDNSIAGKDRSDLLDGFEGEVVRLIREMVHGMVEPRESYKVTETPNGASLTEVFVKFAFEVKETSGSKRTA